MSYELKVDGLRNSSGTLQSNELLALQVYRVTTVNTAMAASAGRKGILVGIAAAVPLKDLEFVLLKHLPPALILLCAAVPPPVAQHKHIVLLVTCIPRQL